MTERHRHRPDSKAAKKAAKRADKQADKKPGVAPRRRKDSVSLADRLGGSTPGKPQGKATSKSGPTTVLPAGSKPTTVQPQTRKQLREQREQQQREARKRWGVTGIAVLAVVVVGALLVVWLAGRGDDEAAPTEVGRTERTLTMTLADGDKAATSGALMVYDVDNVVRRFGAGAVASLRRGTHPRRPPVR